MKKFGIIVGYAKIGFWKESEWRKEKKPYARTGRYSSVTINKRRRFKSFRKWNAHDIQKQVKRLQR